MSVSFERSASQLLSELATAAPTVGQIRKRRSFLFEQQQQEKNGGQSEESEDLTVYPTSLWPLKPACVSPLECARYGWICLEKDLLQCVTCKNYLSGHLPSPSNIDFYNKCTERLKKSLVESHSTTCHWKSSPSPDFEIAPNTLDRKEVLAEFTGRVNSLSYANLELKSKTLVSFDGKTNISREEVEKLAAMCECDINIAFLAISGWSAGEFERTISCKYCLRTVGLWQFQDQPESPSNAGPDQSPIRKRSCSNKTARKLNPLSQHHTWCPWKGIPESFSAVQTTQGQQPMPDSEITRWRAVLNLLLGGEAIMTSESTPVTKKKSSASFVLAKQLMEETVSSYNDDSNNDLTP